MLSRRKHLFYGLTVSLIVIVATIVSNACAQNLPPDPSLDPNQTLQSVPTELIGDLPTSAETATQTLKTEKQTVATPKDPFAQVETTLFDIYLGDKFKGSVLADYTEDTLTISEPSVVVEQLKDVKKAELLLPLLTGPIERRKELADVGAVSFDLNSFRIIIDVLPSFVQVSDLDLKRISPDPDAGLSLQQRIGATASGAADKDLNSAVNHRSIVTYGEYFGVADGTVVSNQGYQVTEANFGGILGDYRASGGLLQTLGNAFTPSLQFSGMSVETAQELFLDQDLIRGSAFTVFVPSRSKVEFYRDGRLLSVQVLDFGLREVNTSAFPQGSYDVDIIMTDNFGKVTRDRKFFTKAGFLASRAQPIYSVQAGRIRDDLEFLDVPIYQAGVRWRATDIFDLAGSVYGSENMNICTVQSNGLYRDIRFSGGYSASSENDTGVTGSLGATILGTNFDVNTINTLQGGTKQPPVPTPDPNDPFAPIFNTKSRNRELVFEDRTSLSGNIYRQIGQFDIRHAWEKSSGEGTPDRHRYGPTAEWRILDEGNTNLRLQGSRFNTDQGKISSVGLIYGYRLSKHWTLSSQIAHRTARTSDDNIFLLALNYDAKSRNDIGTRFTYHNEIQDKKDSEGKSTTSMTNQVDINETGGYLQALGFVRNSATSDDKNTAVGLSALSSFLVSPDGSLSIAHPVTEGAVFIAEVPSSTTASEFEVLLNDQVSGVVQAGSKAVVGVTPYRKYNIKIRPVEGADLVDYDPSVTTTTFFPGNVVKRVFNVEKVFILLGRLVDENGTPLARERIKGPREYTATEEDGTFQAEISGDEVLQVETATRHCKLQVDLSQKPEYFLNAGDVTCVAVD